MEATSVTRVISSWGVHWAYWLFADVDDGEPPDGSQVDVLVKGSAVDGAVPEEADGHLSALLHLRGQAGPRGQAESARHDAVGAQHSHGEIRDVHGASLALAVAGDASEELGHHAPDVGALGDAVTMAPVGGGDVVGIGEMSADPDSHRLLTDVGVQRPQHLALAGLVFRLLFKEADPPHGGVHVQQFFRRRTVDSHGCGLSSVSRDFAGPVQRASQPPSTNRLCPVTMADAALDR